MRVVKLRAKRGRQAASNELKVGQRVRISRAGEDGMNIMASSARTGVVMPPQSAYPGSISVLRDGSKSPLCYHASYWEPI